MLGLIAAAGDKQDETLVGPLFPAAVLDLNVTRNIFINWTQRAAFRQLMSKSEGNNTVI